ncbi:MAG: FtsX-like permease family protein [Propionibacteriaceae bacterium]|jgi:putative ABC transport system permease protein|nr:FtsX-like permease family protein [Propionibacteriaceae bacterium]
MTSADLALRNVRKNLRDYTIYFLTLTFGVCVFYSFNAVESQQAIMGASASSGLVFQDFSQIIALVSIFVSLVLGLLILYANRFLVRRRKKEFGIYLTLGMSRGRVSRILIGETVLVGLLSLLTGLALGVSLSQGMALVTAKLMRLPIERMQFVFSPQALIKTTVYFGVIFLLLLVFNTVMVSRQKLINLIQANSRGEWFRTPRLGVSVAMFMVALGCLAVAYAMVLVGGPARALDVSTLRWVLLLVAVGTGLFFFALSGFLIKLLQRRRAIYLRGLNTFVVRQLSSKINTAHVSITLVCLMLAVSIGTLSLGLGVSKSIAYELGRGAPFDATFRAAANPAAGPAYRGVDLTAALEEVGLPLETVASRSLAVRYYEAGLTVPLWLTQNGREERYDVRAYLLRLSDYNAVLALMGQPQIALPQGRYAVNYAVTNAAMARATEAYIASKPTIDLAGERLTAGPDTFHRQVMEVLRNQDFDMTMVVPDRLVEGLPPARDVLHLDYLDPKDRSEALVQQAEDLLRTDSTTRLSLWTRLEVESFADSTSVMLAYVAIYLGLVFLIAAAAVLAIGQLSDMSDSLGRYRTLRQIGTDDKMVDRAVLAQSLTYFGLPLALALAHAVVGLVVAERLLGAFDKGSVVGSGLFTVAVLAVVYGGYFLATYQGSKAMLRRQS